MGQLAHLGLPYLYKGAGPGTHWHQTDARLQGFRAPRAATGTLNFLLSHITAYSQASPYTSFSTSFAIARSYALAGPKGAATKANPGHVYVVDLQQLPPGAHVKVVDPLAEVIGALNGSLAHDHNGDVGLMAQLAMGLPLLATTPGRFNKAAPLRVTHQLQVLINAMRDAELLVEGMLAPAAVIDRDDVY